MALTLSAPAADVPASAFLWETIIDVIDGTDGSLIAAEARDLSGQGQTPILLHQCPNGVDQMVAEILRRKPAVIDLLRIHGHGLPGVQSISGPTVRRNFYESDLAQSRASISYCNFDRVAPALLQLRDLFQPGSEVWLKGCNVGYGYLGTMLVRKLSSLWNVNVRAGWYTQWGDKPLDYWGPVIQGRRG